MTCTKHNSVYDISECVFCLAEASGQAIPSDRFDPNPIPWTTRPVKTYVYKFPIGEVFTPLAPEGTIMFETNDEDLARFDNALMQMFGETKVVIHPSLINEASIKKITKV